MANISVDSVLQKLEMLETQPGMTCTKDQIHTLGVELRFLKMFSCFLAKCEQPGKNMHLGSVTLNTGTVLKEVEQYLNDISGLTENPESKVEDYDSLVSNLLEKVQQFKPVMKEISVGFLDCSLQSKSCTGDEIIEFMDSVIWNLKGLKNSEARILVPSKEQIRTLEEQLSFLRNLVDFTAKRCIELEKLEDFLAFSVNCANSTGCFSLLYWLDRKDEDMASGLEIMVSDILRKVKPSTPDVAGMYIGVLKASKSSKMDKFLAGQIVARIEEALLEDMISMKDSIDVLHQGLVFLITFLMDPPKECASDVDNAFLTQIDAIIDEVVSVICSNYMNEMKDDVSTEFETCIFGLQDKIKKVKIDARELYVQFPYLSCSNFPSTNALGFIDFFLVNLEKMLKCDNICPPFAKHKVVTIQGELLSLRPFLKDVMELQNEQIELKDLWKRIISVTYQAEHAINSCLIIQHPIWYDLMCLSDVMEEIKLLLIEVNKINVKQMYNTKILGAMTNSGLLIPAQSNTSRLDDVVVGYNDEANAIIDRLTRGSTKLDIVSIVGMPGLGKTTLAKKVYNDPSVKYYFNRSAWCCISQVYKFRELLLDILSDLTSSNVRLTGSNTSDEDLVEQLWKSLKGRKYLIVLDDIWDIGAWNDIKDKLPDDNIGSRIMFTSRIHNLVLQAKPNCSPHPLRSFSEEESWELLEEKMFGKDCCPPDLIEVGKRISKNCKGLPLSVVLVAGILARTQKNLHSWTQVETGIGSQIANEGCMDVLELSYKQLPDCLRPCFLYFAAFPEDRVVGVQKLMKLWIAEGFIQRTEGKCLDDVAEEHLADLIGRSLVNIAKRSSTGKIKACRVHDLVRDLCLAKVKEEKFLQWIHNSEVSHNSWDSPRYDQYRLCVDSEWTQFIKSSPQGSLVNSLQLFGKYEIFQPQPNPSSLFNNFRLLKVMDLECIYIDGPFPEETILIVHMRYFALWCHIT